MIVLLFTVGLLLASLFWWSALVTIYRTEHEWSWECAGYALVFLVLGFAWPLIF